MKVYRMNDTEWYMADSLENAIAMCSKDCELPPDEACDKPRECTPEEMERLIFHGENRKTGNAFLDDYRVTFAKELSMRVEAGMPAGFFATTEF